MARRISNRQNIQKRHQALNILNQRLNDIDTRFGNIELPMKSEIINSPMFHQRATNTAITLTSKKANQLTNTHPTISTNNLNELLNNIQHNLLTYDQSEHKKWQLINDFNQANQMALQYLNDDEPIIQNIESLDHASQEAYLPVIIQSIQGDIINWQEQYENSNPDWLELRTIVLNGIISLQILNAMPKYRSELNLKKQGD